MSLVSLLNGKVECMGYYYYQVAFLCFPLTLIYFLLNYQWNLTRHIFVSLLSKGSLTHDAHLYKTKVKGGGDSKAKNSPKTKRNTASVDFRNTGQQGKDNNLTWSQLLPFTPVTEISFLFSCTGFPIRATWNTSGDQSGREYTRVPQRTQRRVEGGKTVPGNARQAFDSLEPPLSQGDIT